MWENNNEEHESKFFCHDFPKIMQDEQRTPSQRIAEVLFYVWHRLLQNEEVVEFQDQERS